MAQTKKAAAKAAPKKAAAKAENQKSVFILPKPGEKISPVPSEMANGKPVVFQVKEAEGSEKENKVYIEPVGNFYTTGQWQIVDSKMEVNY